MLGGRQAGGRTRGRPGPRYIGPISRPKPTNGSLLRANLEVFHELLLKLHESSAAFVVELSELVRREEVLVTHRNAIHAKLKGAEEAVVPLRVGERPDPVVPPDLWSFPVRVLLVLVFAVGALPAHALLPLIPPVVEVEHVVQADAGEEHVVDYILVVQLDG